MDHSFLLRLRSKPIYCVFGINNTCEDLQRKKSRSASSSTVCAGIQRELRLWIIVPSVFAVQKTAESGDLGGQIHDNDLHLDFKLQL